VDGYSTVLSELIAHRLLEAPAVGDELEEAIIPVVVAQGWQSRGVPLDVQQARWSVHRSLYHWRLFGLLDEVRPRWEGSQPTGPNITSLSAAGRPAALAYLRARATAARRDLHV
jgi:hypothetical protein